MWNNADDVRQSRYRLVWGSALWTFFTVLSVAGVVGYIRSVHQIQARQQQVLHDLYRLQKFEAALMATERDLLGLASAHADAVRTAGYNPSVMRRELHTALAEAEHLAQLLFTQQGRWDHAPAGSDTFWNLTRVRVEWQRARALLREFLNRSQESEPNLPLLRAFRHDGQDNLYAALGDLRQSIERETTRSIAEVSRQLWEHLALVMMGLLGVAVRFYQRWVAPARWMREWLQNRWERVPQSANEYELLREYLEALEARLRLAEQFMRDLSMGRTPQPIPPQSADDALARSSFWLMKRVEEYQRQAQERKAV